MLEVWTKLLGSLVMPICGFYIIKKITKSSTKFLSIKTLIGILILYVATIILRNKEYAGISTIAIFALQIIVYREIFDIKIEESLIACGILMFVTFIGDILNAVILQKFAELSDWRNNGPLYLFGNVLVSTFAIIIVKKKLFLQPLQSFYKNMSKKRSVSNMAFMILLIIGLSSIAQNVTRASSQSTNYFVNIIIMLIFFVLATLFIKSKNSYDKLNSEYESMFNYVQNFEDWIEKEQLNRHEYKNQLAVLRCLTSEKKVKDKIDEILEDSINVEGEVVHQLKTLPKGGIKGLMYYKSAIAQKNKIDLTVNISLELHSILSKLSEKEVKVLCHLIGIYFDNAIEAAKETRKKKVLIEIYEIKDRVTFVFSNTFKKAKNFDDRNNKGVSTKGEGHGNGLYYASKLIAQNPWLSQKQEVIDKYYIQQIIVTQKNDHK